jgi:hypothetical protein
MILRSQVQVIVFVAFVLAACGGSPSPSPPGSTTEAVTGDERFGWDQPAADAAELASFRYALYVDDVRSDAADVSCAATQTSGRFACSCRLPTMSTGSHTIQVAAFVSDSGNTLESPRSPGVRVVKR